MNNIKINENNHKVTINGKTVTLTTQEIALLEVLMEQSDSTVSRETLLRKAWGYQSIGVTRTVDVHIQRLRKKLGIDNIIETVYKAGYRLRIA